MASPAAAWPNAAGVHTDIEPGPGERRRPNIGAGASFLVGRSATRAAIVPIAISATMATPLSKILVIQLSAAMVHDTIRFAVRLSQNAQQFVRRKSIPHLP